MNKVKWYSRFLLMLIVAIIHATCYYLVNYINGLRSPTALLNYEMTIDRWIPYLSWTWTFYYFGHIYIVLCAGIIVWLLPAKQFLRAIYVYIGTIILGAGIQLLVPSHTPWPETMGAMQNLMHTLIHTGPFACFPSMHVTLTVLPAYISLFTLHSRRLKLLTVIFAVLITVSTLTLKEHNILDVFSGMLLALLAGLVWRANIPILFKRTEPQS